MFALDYVKDLVKKDPAVSATIIHDYDGIKKWATGEWQAKKSISQIYKRRVDSMPEVMSKISFVHQKSHTGVTSENSYLNHLADRVAAGEIEPGNVLSVLIK